MGLWTVRGLGAALAGAFALALAWLSQMPTTYAGPDDALLRLSWRTEGLVVETCRARTAEELEELAPHMRTPEVCTGLGAEYLLRVVIDGDSVAQDTIVPAGARRDRPVYVFREFPMPPGEDHVNVTFSALVPAGFEADDAPPPLEWSGDVLLGPTEIALLTLDEAGGSLQVRAR